MVFSTMFNKQSRYEMTEVESINIEPEFFVSASSPGSTCHEKRNGSFDLPGYIVDETEVNWTDFPARETEAKPAFNLLPNGKRKKSFRTKVRNTLIRKLSYRRAAYALDSRRTSLGDSFSASSKTLKTFVLETVERLRPSEASWADFDDLFSGTNQHFIPFMNMNPRI